MAAVIPGPDPRFLPPSPFSRLVVAHATMVAGDACFTVSLAGSIFFQGPASGSRSKVLLYLLIAFAPFAIVGPILGPALDRVRGGRRLLIIVSALGRATLALVMAQVITKTGSTALLVYPLAFGVLVLQKGYSVAKSSLVPGFIDDDAELVRANSRLAVISTIATPIGCAVAALVQWLFGADWSLVLAVFVFTTAAVLATKIPHPKVLARDPDKVQLEKDELHQPSILLAGSAMALLRSAVGYLAVFMVFALRGNLLGLGIAGGCAVGGAFVGNFIAPALRDRFREEVILDSAIIGASLLVVFGALLSGFLGFAIAGLAIGVGAASGKLGFDSLLQRDGPDAARGRAFARFETRFQLTWGIGALLGLIPLAHSLGLLALGLTLLFGGLSYFAALRAARGRVYRTTIRPKVFDEVFDKAKSELLERRRATRGRSSRRDATKGRVGRRRAPEQGGSSS